MCGRVVDRQELLDMIVVEGSHDVLHPQRVRSGKNCRHRDQKGGRGEGD